MAWLPVAVVATVAAAVHVVVATRYGWHPDEFYYVVCGRRPAWGYFDHPPLTPLLARAAAAIPDGLLALRLLAVVAQVGCIILGALLAAEFGGKRLAQVFTAAAVAACPVFVAASTFFGATLVDQVVWTATLFLVARALRLGTAGAWLLAGAAAGVGLENKHTIAVLIVGVAMGLLICRREVLRTAGPWLAGGLAVVVAAPNVAWNAIHGWPNLRFARLMSGWMGGPLGSLSHLPLLALVWAGPLLVLLWVFGVRWLSTPSGREHRWVLVVAAVAVLGFTVSGGRPYYAAPVLVALFAAGAVRVEAKATAGAARWANETPPPLGWTAVIAVSFVGAVLVCLPVLPVTVANALRGINPILVETYGWPQITDQVAAKASLLPDDVPIFTSTYGEASALTVLGPAAGMNRPVYSGDNNYGLWGPPSGRPDTVLCVGKFPAMYLRQYWSQVKQIANITVPEGVRNGESGTRIYLCQQPRGSWATMWPDLRHSSGARWN